MKKANGIILASSLFLACIYCGCSQDDDNYDSDMYTLAEGMGTRMVEPPPVNNVVLSDTVYNTYEITLSYRLGTTIYSYNAGIHVIMYRMCQDDADIPVAELMEYSCSNPLYTVDEAWLQERTEGTGYALCAKGKDNTGRVYQWTLENFVFF